MARNRTLESVGFDIYPDETSPCSPQTEICGFAFERALESGNGQTNPDAAIPSQFNFADKTWRDFCMSEKAHIPAGYTYLGQLIGHDLGHSAKLSHVPYARRPNDPPAPDPKYWDHYRYNLIENPLTLETVYGPGPVLLPHLYDPRTFLFRVRPYKNISLPHVPGDESIRALYDSRNRDTTILHRLVVIWMKFHNRIALELNPDLATGQTVDLETRTDVYAKARTYVLSLWHRLILTEFLPRFVDPDVMTTPADIMGNDAVMDDITALHGLFRAFHALPRSEYKFHQSEFSDSKRKLKHFLLKDLGDDESVVSQWKIDWSLFFGDATGGTKTGICASFSPDLVSPRGVRVPQLDAATSKQTGASHLLGSTIQNIVRQMPAAWRDRLAPAQLAAEFNARYQAGFGADLSEQDIKNSPLFLVLMIEAQLHGRDGRFGPLGSILLKRTMENAIANTEFLLTDIDPKIVSRPASVLELIQSAKP